MYETKANIERKLATIIRQNEDITDAFLLIHSDKNAIHWNTSFKKGIGNELQTADPHKPYHIASINKTMVATIVVMFIEEGRLHYDDPISNYLDKNIMENLHVYKGYDYSNTLQIHHLLSHTSGLPDYFSTKLKNGKPFLEQVIDDPTRFQTLDETMNWVKANFKPLFPPGKKCTYTDTGFGLLTLIIESITSKPIHEVVHDYIFAPLKMDNTYFSMLSTPAVKADKEPLNIFKDGIELDPSNYQIFKGQVISTSHDLQKFMSGLLTYKLVSEYSLKKMTQWSRLWVGVDYGYGLMRIRPVPLKQKYHLMGHLGSTSSFMLYNFTHDTYFIGNFNHFGMTTKTVRFVFYALRNLAKSLNRTKAI